MRLFTFAMLCGAIALISSVLEPLAAQALVLHKPKEAITITATPDGSGTTAHQVLRVAGAPLTCSGLAADATDSSTAETVETIELGSLAFSNCLYVGQTATVETNGCKFVLHIPGKVIDISCSLNGIRISVPSPFCEIVIPNQTGKSEVTFHNASSNTEVTLEQHVTGIVYSAIGAGCPVPGANQSNGNYETGNLLLTAEKKGTQTMVPISVE